MKKHFRTLCTLFFALVSSLCLAVGLTACETHEHSWAEDWSSDATHHWHAPACDDTDEVKDKAEHVDEDENGKCDTCDYEVGHEHTWDNVWHGDAEGHWHNATCSHTDATSAKEPHVDANEDESCDLCGEFTKHEHTWAEAYESNAEGHWHKATCSHTTETTAVEPHTDVDEDGKCDTCDYEVGHEHKWADEWEYNEDGHWHRAICTHTTETTTPEPHHLDAVGDCAECDYHQHVFAEIYSVDVLGHWYEALCGHTEAETYGFHNFVEGKCDTCGLEQVEDTVYNEYYKKYATFFKEEVLDFSAWHASLVAAGVKHVEITETKDVVYTYAVEGEEDVTKIVYYTDREVNITLTRGNGMDADSSFPSVTYSIVAIVRGDEGLKNEVVATATSGISGEGTATFVPYYGTSVTYKLVVEEVNGNFIINNDAATIPVGESIEPVGILYNVWAALGVGENNKIQSVTFAAAGKENVTKSFGIKAPEGWYWLTYDRQDDDAAVGTGVLAASIDGGSWFDLYTTRDGKKFEALIYVPAGASIITFKNYYYTSSSFTDGRSATLTPYKDTTIEKLDQEYFISTGYAADSAIPAPEFDVNLTPGEYIVSVTVVGYGTAISNMTIGGKSVSLSSGKAIVSIGEKDKLSVKVTYTQYYKGNRSVAKVVFSSLKSIEKDKAESISLTADNMGGVYYAFKAPKSGVYTITLASAEEGEGLAGVRIGAGVAATGYITGAESADTASYDVWVEKDEAIGFNVNVSSSTYVPKTVTLKITDAQLEAATLGVNTVTFSANAKSHYRTFTAEKEGTYVFTGTYTYNTTASTNATGLRYCRIGVGSSVDNILAQGTASRYSAAGAIYLKAGESIVLNVNYNYTSYYGTFTYNITLVAPTELTVGEATNLVMSSDKIYGVVSFTAPEAGTYPLNLALGADSDATNLTNVLMIDAKAHVISIPKANLSSKTLYSIHMELEKGETVVFVFVFEASAAISTTTKFPTVAVTMGKNLVPQTITANTPVELTISNTSSSELYTFTAPEDGTYRIMLSSGTGFRYLKVTSIDGKTTYISEMTSTTYTASASLLSLKKGDTLSLLVVYSNTTTTEYKANLSIVYAVEANTTKIEANKGSEITYSADSFVKYLTFTAPEAGTYRVFLSSATSVSRVYLYRDGTTTTLLTASTTNNLKYITATVTLEKDEVINIEAYYNPTTVAPVFATMSLGFYLANDTTTQKITEVNKAIEVSLDLNTQVKYYSFTASAAGTYKLIAASETTIAYLRVYKAGTTTSYINTSSGTYAFYNLALKEGDTVVLEFFYQPPASATVTTYPFKVNFSINLPVIKDVAVNTKTDITFSKDAQLVSYKFKAPEAGLYTLILTSETSLKDVHVLNDDGSNVIAKIASDLTFSTVSLTLTEGQEYVFIFNYEAGANYPAIKFEVNREGATALTVNENTTFSFSDALNTKYLSFTATDAAYYTIVMSSETDLKNIKVLNSDTGAAIVAKITANSTFNVATIKLTEGQKLNLVVVYEDTANHPTVAFRIEYSTPTALTANTKAEFKFSNTNTAEYYSFTAATAGLYALQLESANLQNVKVLNAATGTELVKKIEDENTLLVTISTAFDLAADAKLTLLVIYDGALAGEHGVSITMATTSDVTAVANETKVAFSAGNNIKHLKFTAATEGTLALSLLAGEDASLDNVVAYTTTGASLTLPVKMAFNVGDTYEFIVVYNGTDKYPELTFSAEEALLAPTGVKAIRRLIMWNPVEGATGYRVYRAISSTGTYEQVADVQEIFWNDPVHVGNSQQSRYYKVTAYNEKGESDLSSYVTGTLCGATTGLQTAEIGVTVPEGFPASVEKPVYLILVVGSKYYSNGDWFNQACIKITGAGSFSTNVVHPKSEAVAGIYDTATKFMCSGLPEGYTYTAGSFNATKSIGTITAPDGSTWNGSSNEITMTVTPGYLGSPNPIDMTKLKPGTYKVTISHNSVFDTPDFTFFKSSNGTGIVVRLTGPMFGTETTGNITITEDIVQLYLGSNTLAGTQATITFTPA